MTSNSEKCLVSNIKEITGFSYQKKNDSILVHWTSKKNRKYKSNTTNIRKTTLGSNAFVDAYRDALNDFTIVSFSDFETRYKQKRDKKQKPKQKSKKNNEKASSESSNSQSEDESEVQDDTDELNFNLNSEMT